MLFLVILIFNFVVFINGVCPPGTIPTFRDKSLCYSFNANPTDFLDAEENCQTLVGHLTSVHSMLDNMFLSQQAASRFTDSDFSDFWFGANDLIIAGNWSWIDGSPFDIKDWDKGQPQNTVDADCGAMILKSGKWKSDDCSKQKPFVCTIKALDTTIAPATTTTSIPTTTTTRPPTTTIKPKPKTCPSTWTYGNLTGFCYKILHNENWANSETICSAQKAHLASIHSQEESLFVAELAYPGSDNGKGSFTWTGWFSQDNGAHWEWIDGTPFDYIKWQPGQPNGGEYCLLIYNGVQSPLGLFWDFGCEEIIGSFACKKLPE